MTQTNNSESKNVTETEPPDFFSITQPPNESSETTPQMNNVSTFIFAQSSADRSSPPNVEEKVAVVEEENTTTIEPESSGNNETDSEMVMAISEDNEEDASGSGSGSGKEEETKFSMNDEGNGADNDTSPSFVFNLPDDVTAPVNGEAITSSSTTTTTSTTTPAPIQSTPQSNTSEQNSMGSMQMPANYMIQEPNKNLPERIRTLLKSDIPTEQNSTTERPNQNTLVNQLYNGRKTAIDNKGIKVYWC